MHQVPAKKWGSDRSKKGHHPIAKSQLLGLGAHRKALKIIAAEAHVGKQSCGVFVKMQKSTGLAIEDAALFFFEWGQGTQAHQQGL